VGDLSTLCESQTNSPEVNAAGPIINTVQGTQNNYYYIDQRTTVAQTPPPSPWTNFRVNFCVAIVSVTIGICGTRGYMRYESYKLTYTSFVLINS
jgi:hypothetical protein